MKRSPKLVQALTSVSETDEEISPDPEQDATSEALVEQPAEDVETSAPPRNAIGKPKEDKEESRAAGRLTQTPEQLIRRREQDQSVNDWLDGLRDIGPLQFKLARMSPKFIGNKKCNGHLTTLEGFTTEDEISERFGGGTYKITVMRRAADGSWRFYTTTTIEIAGDPRMDSLPGAENQGSPSAVAASRAAEIHERSESSAVERMTTILEKRLDRAESAGSNQAETMKMFMRPMELQIASLQDALKESSAALREAGKTPVNPHQDQLITKLIDGDSSRMTALSEKLQSEMRMLQEHAREDEKRLREEHKRDMDRLERQHEREIATLKAAYEQVTNANTLAHKTSGTVQEAEIRRYERELIELRAEVKELRAKKDMTLLEKVKEVDAIKDMLGAGDDEKEEKSTLEKLVEVAVNSDKLMGLAGKFMGGDPAAAAAQAAAAQKAAAAVQAAKGPRVLRDRRTGETFLRTPEGDRIPVRPRRMVQEGVDGTPTPDAPPPIDPEKVAMATMFLQTAFANNHDPVNVATTARSAVPEEILQAIRDHGVDDFLNKVAKLPSTSPLSTQAGRNWTRKLGKALIGE